MGTVYYLVRDDNKTLFELGKMYGCQVLFGQGKPHPLPIDIRVRLEDFYRDRPNMVGDLPERLIAWAGDAAVRLLSDDDYDWEDVRYERNYRITGTRYTEDPFPYHDPGWPGST